MCSVGTEPRRAVCLCLVVYNHVQVVAEISVKKRKLHSPLDHLTNWVKVHSNTWLHCQGSWVNGKHFCFIIIVYDVCHFTGMTT